MNLIGLDLNATRARALQGETQASSARTGLGLPVGLLLDSGGRDLPLAVSLEERRPEVGRAGVALCRRAPHLACLDFLAHLGDGRTWDTGRHRLDAGQALVLVLDHLQRRFARPAERPAGVTVAVPAYLTPAQVGLLAQLTGARLPLLGTVPAPVAAAVAAADCLPWSGLAVVVDLDDHALTWSAVAVGDDAARLVHVHPSRHLGRGAWLGRLLDGAAHRCVRQSRRDPRESAEAEQCLYDQLAALLDAPGGDGPAELILQTAHWYQHLLLPQADLAAFCRPLVHQAIAEMQIVLEAVVPLGPVGAVLMTAAAARLPGLIDALDALILPADAEPPAEEEADADFGESLIPEEQALTARLHLLDDDAVARAAYDLAVRQGRGHLPKGHLDAAPLPGGGPAAETADRGPARLSFRGAEHPLAGTVFLLGRDPACDLVFESELYPAVSARHCEIVLDRGAYLLRDRSRHGTLVNDCPVPQPVTLRSGDWIRLGPTGPVLRFLGRPSDQRRLMTTA